MPALGGVGGGEGGKAEAFSLALLSKKGVGREGSIESQQKFDFFVLILCLIDLYFRLIIVKSNYHYEQYLERKFCEAYHWDWSCGCWTFNHWVSLGSGEKIKKYNQTKSGIKF